MKKIVLYTLVSGSMMFACQSAKEKAADELAEAIVESASNGEVDVETLTNEDGEATIKIKTEDGNATFETNVKSLPEDFPSDVYQVEGEIKQVTVIGDDKDKSITYSVIGGDDIKATEQDIRDNMTDGWKIVTESNLGKMIVLNFQKENDENKTATYTIVLDEDKEQSLVTVITTF